MLRDALTAAALLAASASAADKPKGKVGVDLYVMSQCPFGVQAENALLPLLKAYGDKVDLRLLFIAGEGPGADGKPVIGSMHGEPEVREDRRQLCALKLDAERGYGYILERNKNVNSPDWRGAAGAAGIDAEALEACETGPLGQALLSENIKPAALNGVNASPTVLIDGKPYSGSKSAAGFEYAICAGLRERGGKLPPGCEKALAGPPPPPDAVGGGSCAPPVDVAVKIVIENSCAASFCPATLAETIKKNHPAARISPVDAGSAEGKALVAKHGASVLPLYVLDKAVEGEANFKGNLDAFYSASAGAYVIKPGPRTFFPAVQLRRARDPGHLDVFVQPLTQSSIEAADGLLRYIHDRGRDLKDLSLSWHFVVQEAPDVEEEEGGRKKVGGGPARTRLIAGGGEAELEESLRQACLFQHASFAAFTAYLRCRYSDAADPSLGARCLEPKGKVKECLEGGEGAGLLRADAALAVDLAVPAPALLWENRYGPFPWNSVDLDELLRGRR